MIAVLVLVLTCSVWTAEAAKPGAKIGAALRSVLRLANVGDADVFVDFYKPLTLKQKGTVRMILKVVQEETGSSAQALKFVGDMKEMQRVLKDPHLSNYTKDLPAFLDDVNDFMKGSKALGADSHREAKKTLLTMLAKVKEGGDVGPHFSAVKGGVAEVIETAAIFRDFPGCVRHVQPRIGGRLFREAECFGGLMTGRWFLEVKNYPFFKLKSGRDSLRAQVKSHVSRMSGVYKFTEDTNIDEVPGVIYRFAKAGPDDENFGAFAGAIKAAFIQTLEARSIDLDSMAPAQIATIKQKIKDFVDSRIVVDLVEVGG